MTQAFCRVVDGAATYPFDLSALVTEGVLLGPKAHPDTLARYGVFHVFDQPRPDHGPTEVAEIAATPALIDGFYQRVWTVRAKTAEEVAADRAAMPPASRMQFAIALASAGVITSAEAKAFAGGNDLPALALGAIAQSGMSELEKTAAEIRALSAATIARSNPLVLLLQQAVPLTDAQADDLFRAALAIE